MIFTVTTKDQHGGGLGCGHPTMVHFQIGMGCGVGLVTKFGDAGAGCGVSNTVGGRGALRKQQDDATFEREYPQIG